VPKRSYEQFCPLARTLDLVGERWTLLIVRDLIAGPKRYTDLSRGLPGLATDLLTERLRRLEEAGAVRRRELSPPAAVTVYELTDRGRELEPAILGLARFGVALLSDAGAASTAPNPDHFALLLRVLFDPERAPAEPETWSFEGAGRSMTVTLGDGDLDVRPGGEAPDGASPRFIADLTTTLEWIFGTLDTTAALVDGRLRIQGDENALARLRAAFPAPQPAYS
jgi:DNA-binding HxlR family transcriptional regulator